MSHRLCIIFFLSISLGFILCSPNVLNWQVSLLIFTPLSNDHFSCILQVLMCIFRSKYFVNFIICSSIHKLLEVLTGFFCDWFLIPCYGLLVIFCLFFSPQILQSSYNICMLFRASWKSYRSLLHLFHVTHTKTSSLPVLEQAWVVYPGQAVCPTRAGRLTLILLRKKSHLYWNHLMSVYVFSVWTCLALNNMSH